MANENRAMSVALPFVLHGIDTPSVANVAVRAAWLYACWRKMLSSRSFDESELNSFRSLTEETQQAINELSQCVTQSLITRSIKFHMMHHFESCIRRYGAPTNFDTETYESAHKVFVTRWLGNQRGNILESTLMHKDRVSDLHTSTLNSSQQSTTKQTGVFRDRRITTRLHELKQAWRLLLSEVEGVTQNTLVTQYDAVWCSISDCWVRLQQPISYMWNSMNAIGIVEGLVVLELQTQRLSLILLQPCPWAKPAPSSPHFLHKLVSEEKLFYVKKCSEHVRAIQAAPEQHFVPVQLHPDFSIIRGSHFFVNNLLF